jgi:DUF1009 family protein
MPAAPQSSLVPDVKKIGIIAGGGSLPAKLAQTCEDRGIEAFIVAFEGHADPALLNGRNHMISRIGAAGRIIETLKFHEVRDLVLIGSVRRPGLAELRPDWRAMRFFARAGLRALGDDGLLKALKEELQYEGFRLRGIQEFIGGLVGGAGPVGKSMPDGDDRTDIERGLAVLRITGGADIGQSVVVQEGIVLGLEAAEGTDELIRRCAGYKRAGRGGVLVKAAKPGQDTDLDLPSIGPDTVKRCAEAGLCGIAFEAGRTLLVDPQEVATLADAHKIFVVGV